MPCDSVIQTSVLIPKMDLALRKLALQALGAEGINDNSFRYAGQLYRFAGDTLVGPDETVADLLKRSYSAEVVKYTARRAGWAVKQTAPFQYQLVKR